MRLYDLKYSLQQEKNRLKMPDNIGYVGKSIQRTIKFLEQEVAALETLTKQKIMADEILSKKYKILTEQKGIGDKVDDVTRTR